MTPSSITVWMSGYDVIIKPASPDLLRGLDFVQKDSKRDVYHCLPVHFFRLIERFPDAKLLFEQNNLWSATLAPKNQIQLRDYQQECHTAWLLRKRGVVVLPTGTGKTIQGLMAIDELRCSTLIVVPTIDLLYQWKEAVITHLGIAQEQVGILGGGFKEILPLTITTYDSASIYIKRLQLFKLVIFDEVHHLPTATNRTIAQGLVAPYRLGLSATPERIDELHRDLPSLVGDVVFRRGYAQLKEHIADFAVERIDVDLSEEEEEQYKQHMKLYRAYLASHKLFFYGKNAYQQLIYRVGRDPQARKALLAHQSARKIALNAQKKMNLVKELLQKHRADKVLIFSEFNIIVDAISQTFLVPAITYRTDKKERKLILDGFRAGTISKLVTGRVLDEGVDVPDASVGIIVSGSGSERAYIQRLGRIIRPKERQALLYELVTTQTVETATAHKRRKGIRGTRFGTSPAPSENSQQ